MPDKPLPGATTEQITQDATSAEQTAATESAQQATSQEQKPLTPEEARQIAREEATRIAQSQVAKGENRINKRIQEGFAALELNKAALGLSDEQIAQARQKIVTDAFAAPDVKPQAAQPGSVQTEGEEPLHPLLQAAYDMQEAEGVEIEENSLEFQQFIAPLFKDANATIDYRLLEATRKAIDARKLRLASNKDKAAARLPGGGGGVSDPNDIAGITDSKTLYKLGERKIGGQH